MQLYPQLCIDMANWQHPVAFSQAFNSVWTYWFSGDKIFNISIDHESNGGIENYSKMLDIVHDEIDVSPIFLGVPEKACSGWRCASYCRLC